jgi:hypothetical protein
LVEARAIAMNRGAELLHLPDKPAGVEARHALTDLAGELLHLPHKPAEVVNDYHLTFWALIPFLTLKIQVNARKCSGR